MCVRTEPGEERARGNAAPDCENEQRSHYVGWGQVRSEGSNCRGDKPERCELALYFYNLTSDLSPLTNRLPLIRNFPSNTILIASVYATCSCSKIRADSVCSSSESSTGTVFCTTMAPWSSSSSTKCTVHPVTFTP